MNIQIFSYVLLCASLAANAQQSAAPPETSFPTPEKLSYRIEWRMVTAGDATLINTRSQQDWKIDLKLESAGLVSRLFKVDDMYKVIASDKFCGINTSFEAQEGKRHTISSQQFDNARHKLIYNEQDLVKKTSEHQELDIPPCTYDIVGALAALREVRLDPGKSVTLPVANGKKMANARIEAQAKETVTIDGKNYSAMRYEAFIFDGVVFRKKGRAFIWLTDDTERLPVQMRFQMGFPIGSINMEMEKLERP